MGVFLSLLRHFKRIQGPITNIKHSITHTHRNQSSHKASYKQPQALRPRQAHSSRIYRHYFATAFPRPSFALSHVPCRARHLRMTRSIILAALVLAACVCSAQGEAPARGVLRPRESEPPPQLLLPRSSLPFPHSKHPSCLSPQQSYHSPPPICSPERDLLQVLLDVLRRRLGDARRDAVQADYRWARQHAPRHACKSAERREGDARPSFPAPAATPSLNPTSFSHSPTNTPTMQTRSACARRWPTRASR